ncbi:MAG: alkaline phosphatase family protein [Candidatus Aminicenantaceae bacterium]
MNKLNRREFIKLSLSAGSIFTLGTTSERLLRAFGKRETSKKVIILGLDGMDPHLVQILMDQGKLPHFQRLRSEGSFKALRTSNPPQSPVAWSNFITGTNPGGHAIFDFIHRDPENYLPVFSSSQTEEAKKTITIGDYVFPLSGGEVKQLRQGKAFWKILEEYDIPATIFKIPSNYPPVHTKQRTISGMNTPDILGTYGIFNYYTTEPTELKEDIGGGRIHEVFVIDNIVEDKLPGPRNTFKKDRPESSIDFKVFIDPVNLVAKILIQNNEFILKEGEWSEWKKVRFSMIPTQSVSGICQFYLKQIRPHFKLYVSPINIDPGNAALPISTPKSYSEELEKKFGPFFTKGLPADTKALDHGVLDEHEFLKIDDFVLKEREEMFDHELSRFDSGLLFYYVSSTDQRQHMFWRLIDKEHPMYDSTLASKYGKVIENIYLEMDKFLAKAMEKTDKNTILMVMSDHGFTPFRRSFNLNTWLKENGYLNLINRWRQGREEFFLNTNWSKTKAYAYGINSLYINQEGREREGIVKPGGEKEALVREIIQKLEKAKDPKTGEAVILKAYAAKDIYKGRYVEQAPDIIVGYNRGYRASWSTPLGRIPLNVIEDNTEKWSGDHCMDSSVIPGILFINRKVKAEYPALYDLTPTILSIFGIEQPKEMIGKPVF